MNKTDSILIHDRTKKQIELFIKNPSHALLIIGQTGGGKNFLAKYITASILGLDDKSNLDNYPYYTHISKPDDKQEISIDTVRELIHKLQLKTPGTKGIRRVIIIEDANSLSTQAQNSLLKVLEEPPADTVILMTAPSKKSVLPTIASRAQHLEVLLASLKDAINYFSHKYTSKDIESAWNLSGGAAGLMIALLDDAQKHPLKDAVSDVKSLLGQNTYGRILTLDKLGKDKEALAIFLDASLRVIAALNRSSSGVANKKVIACRKLVLRLQKQLADNANPRLVALELSLNLNI
jgi:DNA polymerase-3 subunit delta'